MKAWKSVKLRNRGVLRSLNLNSITLPKYLLPIPLILAAIALVLQLTSYQPADNAEFGLFNEAEFNRKSDAIPRLEVEATRTLSRRRSTAATWHSASADLQGQDWAWPGVNATGPRIAFTVTTAESVPQIRTWLSYHKALGVSLFYLFVEGQANLPGAIEELRKEPGITVIPKDEELAKQHASSRVWNESWLSAFFNKPCNHELFVTQSLNMEIGIQLANNDGADWILHIDTDELIYPGGSPKYSLQEVLASVPTDVDLLIFPNYESLAETAEIKEPFTEVSLFKRNYAHVASDAYFKSYQTIQRANPNYFTTYGNGKSAARVIPGLRPNGAHRWHNYFKNPKEWSSDQSAVLHFTYNRFSDLKSRRDRCDCAPTKQDAERCFILPFDREAFLESSLKGEPELMKFFKERLVWDESAVVDDLLKKGLFVRLYEPQLMMRGFKEAERVRAEIEAVAAAAGVGSGNTISGGSGDAAVVLDQTNEQQQQEEQQQIEEKELSFEELNEEAKTALSEAARTKLLERETIKKLAMQQPQDVDLSTHHQQQQHQQQQEEGQEQQQEGDGEAVSVRQITGHNRRSNKLRHHQAKSNNNNVFTSSVHNRMHRTSAAGTNAAVTTDGDGGSARNMSVSDDDNGDMPMTATTGAVNTATPKLTEAAAERKELAAAQLAALKHKAQTASAAADAVGNTKEELVVVEPTKIEQEEEQQPVKTWQREGQTTTEPLVKRLEEQEKLQDQHIALTPEEQEKLKLTQWKQFESLKQKNPDLVDDGFNSHGNTGERFAIDTLV